MITAIYAGLAALFTIFLIFRVVNIRRSEKISVGFKDNDNLERAMRVHANFIETAPLGLFLILLLELQDLNSLFIHLLAITLLAARFVHFQGFKSEEAPMKYRFAGMATTIGVIGISAIINIILGILSQIS